MTNQIATDDRRREQSRRLKRLRRSATGVLAGLAGVFVITSIPDAPPEWVLFIRSMAEAGMVGGLADWFAVEAIFRHPLRIPIPHTALLRNRQAQAAENAGKFIEDYILVPEQIAGRVQSIRPARMIAQWLNTPGNAEHVADLLSAALQKVIGMGKDPANRDKIVPMIRDLIDRAGQSPATSRLMAQILRLGGRGEGLSQTLLLVADMLDQRRDAIEHIVHENSRWWLASGVDRRIAKLIVDSVISFLKDMSDPASEAHAEFSAVFSDFVDKLEAEGTLHGFVRQGLRADQGSRLSELLFDTVTEIGSQVLGSEDEDVPHERLASAIRSIADTLEHSEEAMEALDARITDLAETIAARHRAAIGAYVAETLREWDADVLIDRFEAELGPDLQFVRINGAVLGALIGAVLHLFEKAI